MDVCCTTWHLVAKPLWFHSPSSACQRTCCVLCLFSKHHERFARVSKSSAFLHLTFLFGLLDKFYICCSLGENIIEQSAVCSISWCQGLFECTLFPSTPMSCSQIKEEACCSQTCSDDPLINHWFLSILSMMVILPNCLGEVLFVGIHSLNQTVFPYQTAVLRQSKESCARWSGFKDQFSRKKNENGLGN